MPLFFYTSLLVNFRPQIAEMDFHQQRSQDVAEEQRGLRAGDIALPPILVFELTIQVQQAQGERHREQERGEIHCGVAVVAKTKVYTEKQNRLATTFIREGKATRRSTLRTATFAVLFSPLSPPPPHAYLSKFLRLYDFQRVFYNLHTISQAQFNAQIIYCC